MPQKFGLTGGWLTFWVTVGCATSMTLFGYDQAVFGGVIVTDDFLQTMGNPDANLVGTITSIYDVGCFFGALSGIAFGSKLGRKWSILLGTVVMMIGAILQITAYGVAHMLVGRIVTGLGNGLNTAAAPVWQSETTKASWRGKLVVLGLVLNVAGFCLANWVTYGFSYLDGSISWRFPLALQLLFGIIIIATVPWLPESPRWLISKGRIEEATQIIADLEGDGATTTSLTVVAEKNEILQAYKAEEERGVSWWDLFRGKTSESGPATLRRFILGVGTQLIVQLSGINATSYYLPIVLTTSLGFENKKARLLTAINGVQYTFFAGVGMMLIDKWGRRGAMIIGTSCCAVCYLVLVILTRYNQFSTGSVQERYGDTAVAMIFLYYACFGAGWQGTAWLYNTEINSLHMRMKGASASVAAQWAINYMVVQITPIGIENLQWKFYLIWVVFNWVSIPILYLFYPETANRKLEDIDAMFQEGVPTFVFLDKDAISVKRPEKYVQKELEELSNAAQEVGKVDDIVAVQTHHEFTA